MSSDNQAQNPPQVNQQDINSSSLADLIDTMQSVDTHSGETELNATSMKSNKGDRIIFNEDIATKVF